MGGVIILGVEQYTSCVREEEVSKLRGQTKGHQLREGEKLREGRREKACGHHVTYTGVM